MLEAVGKNISAARPQIPKFGHDVAIFHQRENAKGGFNSKICLDKLQLVRVEP
jgi:hypothetical protein